MQKNGQWDSSDIKSNNRHDKGFKLASRASWPGPKELSFVSRYCQFETCGFHKRGFQNFKESNWNMATSPSVQSGYYSSIHWLINFCWVLCTGDDWDWLKELKHAHTSTYMQKERDLVKVSITDDIINIKGQWWDWNESKQTLIFKSKHYHQ